jgi:hypothetical protein
VFPTVFKNIIITILAIIATLLWLTNDPEEEYDDPDDVTIEYKCSIIMEYKHVPPEVLEECRKRKNTTEDVDNKTSV